MQISAILIVNLNIWYRYSVCDSDRLQVGTLILSFLGRDTARPDYLILDTAERSDPTSNARTVKVRRAIRVDKAKMATEARTRGTLTPIVG